MFVKIKERLILFLRRPLQDDVRKGNSITSMCNHPLPGENLTDLPAEIATVRG